MSTLRGDFTHFVIYRHAGGLVSPAETRGVAGAGGGDGAAAPQLGSLGGFDGADAAQGRHFHPAQMAFSS